MKVQIILHSRIMIDGESAFSEKNIKTLGIDDLEAVRIWPTTGRKVSMNVTKLQSYCQITLLELHNLQLFTSFCLDIRWRGMP